MSHQDLESFWINIAAGLALLALDGLLKWGHRRITRGNPVYRKYIISALGSCWLALNAAYIHFFRVGAAIFMVLSSAAMAWIIWSEFRQYWRIGLVGADAQIASGLDFRTSLRMVSNSLDFLGIGASKLSAERPAFEAAISRCQRPDRPVRFLLCRPDNDRLRQMAQSADQDEASYQKRVRESLRTIADLRINRAWNIEVRFYREFPTFRLMFIDDSICLASHYVLGKGSGAQLPQLHIVKLRGSRDVHSLYYAFSSYFERFWSEAQPWDFREYLS